MDNKKKYILISIIILIICCSCFISSIAAYIATKSQNTTNSTGTPPSEDNLAKTTDTSDTTNKVDEEKPKENTARIISVMNDGTTSCTNICAGKSGGPWTKEIPVSWNGADCDSTGGSIRCNDYPAGKQVKCNCVANGKGWYSGSNAPPLRIMTFKNEGLVSCDEYCQGKDGKPSRFELPTNWNGAKCVGTEFASVGCDVIANTAIKCNCEQTGTGWRK